MPATQPRVFLFGNPELPFDSLPLRILPQLRERLPNISFEVLDPNEEWDVPLHMHIVDTVVNLREPTVTHGLDAFLSAPRMTCHDFDAYANLLFLKKLGKLTTITVFGVPPHAEEDAVLTWLIEKIPQELSHPHTAY
jgi:hypothetical protein